MQLEKRFFGTKENPEEFLPPGFCPNPNPNPNPKSQSA